ncbi:hypothetical protein AB4Y77_09790 [Paenarthrobacter sp. YAF11_1]|uniref:hypothetical protein n=1 Tax=Paenarthrobacter sp. YAF11_1 TaxID=3233074 RepID=UPI003F95D082
MAGDKRAGRGDPAPQRPMCGCYPKGTCHETQGLNAWGGDCVGSRWVHDANADTDDNRNGTHVVAYCYHCNPDGDSHFYSHCNPDGDAHPHCNSDGDAHPDTDVYPYCNCDGDADADVYPYCNSDGDAHPHADVYPYCNCDGDPDADAECDHGHPNPNPGHG